MTTLRELRELLATAGVSSWTFATSPLLDDAQVNALESARWLLLGTLLHRQIKLMGEGRARRLYLNRLLWRVRREDDEHIWTTFDCDERAQARRLMRTLRAEGAKKLRLMRVKVYRVRRAP